MDRGLYDVSGIVYLTIRLLIPAMMMYRYSYLMTQRGLPHKLGVSTRWPLTKTCLFVIAFHFVDFGLMVALQEYFGRWLYSTANFQKDTEGTIDYIKLISLTFITPILEEVMFRGIVLHIFFKR